MRPRVLQVWCKRPLDGLNHQIAHDREELFVEVSCTLKAAMYGNARTLKAWPESPVASKSD